MTTSSAAFTKYGFRIRTRAGVTVDSLRILGRDEAEAERKLRQMYPGCEILDCDCVGNQAVANRLQPLNYEDVVSLITR